MGGAKAIPINPVHRKMMGFAALYPSYALLNLGRRRRCRDPARRFARLRACPREEWNCRHCEPLHSRSPIVRSADI